MTDPSNQAPLAGRTVLVTGISDGASLATAVAREIQSAGGRVVATGLGPTRHGRHSERAQARLAASFESFRKTVEEQLGAEVPSLACDLSLDESIEELALQLREREIAIDGVLHAVAFDRTLRQGRAALLLETSREDFLECMNVSAYSMVALLRGLLEAGVLSRGASVVALSYLGAARVVSHPYRNVGVAKAALERMVGELAAELGPACGVRVNAVRFSPYSASRAGGAIPGLQEAERIAGERSPIGNPPPSALGLEVVHLLRPESAVTGDVRHVDGGQHLLA